MTSLSRQKTAVCVFASMDEARAAVAELRQAGIAEDQISVVSGRENAGEGGLESRDVATDVAADAGIGAALGGIGGLLLGFTAILIPGVGPAIAAGPLLVALGGAGVGAVAGGLVGALSEAGVPDEEAHRYAENVRGGSVLVTVRGSGADVERAREILDRSGARESTAAPAASAAEHVEGPGSPSECDVRTDDEVLSTGPHTARSAEVIGHNPGGEPMSADEARREYDRYGGQNAGQKVWPHSEAYDLGDSLVREEVLESEEDPVGLAQRTARDTHRARIYEAPESGERGR